MNENATALRDQILNNDPEFLINDHINHINLIGM